MAIQAQCPSTVLFFNRGEERTGVDLSQGMPGFLDPSTVLFSDGGGAVNPRKRGREEAATTALPPATGPTLAQNNNPSNLLFLQPKYISVAQLQSKPTAPLFSTGFQLAFAAQQQQHRTLNTLHPTSPVPFEELAPHLKQYQDEIDGYLRAQRELIRRTLAGKWRSHYRTLLSTAAVAARRRIRAKEVEAEKAARQSAELEERLARLRAESLAWQAKAATAQSQAAALHAELQRAAAAREREGETGDPPGSDDACSAACVDLEPTAVPGSCRACRRQDAAATVVVLPCRHLCLCADCAVAGAGDSCPACGLVSAGSVHVAFS